MIMGTYHLCNWKQHITKKHVMETGHLGQATESVVGFLSDEKSCPVQLVLWNYFVPLISRYAEIYQFVAFFSYY